MVPKIGGRYNTFVGKYNANHGSLQLKWFPRDIYRDTYDLEQTYLQIVLGDKVRRKITYILVPGYLHDPDV